MRTMNMTSTREEHERFVSGHDGGSVVEISIVASVAPATVLLRHLVYASCIPDIWKKNLGTRCMFMIDFTFLILPVLFTMTILSHHVASFLTLIILANVTLIFLSLRSNTSRSSSRAQSRPEAWFNSALFTSSRRPFVTSFRSYVNIASAVCILGVDFASFPRRFAKAETYGTGFMDVGVGSFVISNALVSAEARGKCTTVRSAREMLHRMMRCMFSTWPLWVLGVGRVLAVKGTNYHEHATEYGTHWNFFFTLAVVRILSSLILCFVNSSCAFLISLFIAGAYQFLLSNETFRLSDYILFGRDGRGSRDTGLIDANREGLLSCAGYLAVYFGGVQLGRYLNQNRTKVCNWLKLFAGLVLAGVALCAALVLAETYVAPVSRRMANLPYIIWMMVYNVEMLASFLLVDLLHSFVISRQVAQQQQQQHSMTSLDDNNMQQLGDAKRSVGKENDSGVSSATSDQSTSSINQSMAYTASLDCDFLDGVNRNGLLYFLLTNLLTGMVNFSMTTIHASTQTSMLVMTAYLFVLSVVSSFLHARNYTFRFW